jgi:hypothetical protein
MEKTMPLTPTKLSTLRLSSFIITCLAFCSNVWAQTLTGLPLGLDYSMTKPQVLEQLKAFTSYRVTDVDANTIAFVVPAPDTNTKNALFLKFSNNHLVEISSTKAGMTSALHASYIEQLKKTARKWKDEGALVLHEDNVGLSYVYKDVRSVMLIQGTPDSTASNYSASVTFYDRAFKEQKK